MWMNFVNKTKILNLLVNWIIIRTTLHKLIPLIFKFNRSVSLDFFIKKCVENFRFFMISKRDYCSTWMAISPPRSRDSIIIRANYQEVDVLVTYVTAKTIQTAMTNITVFNLCKSIPITISTNEIEFNTMFRVINQINQSSFKWTSWSIAFFMLVFGGQYDDCTVIPSIYAWIDIKMNANIEKKSTLAGLFNDHLITKRSATIFNWRKKYSMIFKCESIGK